MCTYTLFWAKLANRLPLSLVSCNIRAFFFRVFLLNESLRWKCIFYWSVTQSNTIHTKQLSKVFFFLSRRKQWGGVGMRKEECFSWTWSWNGVIITVLTSRCTFNWVRFLFLKNVFLSTYTSHIKVNSYEKLALLN